MPTMTKARSFFWEPLRATDNDTQPSPSKKPAMYARSSFDNSISLSKFGGVAVPLGITQCLLLVWQAHLWPSVGCVAYAPQSPSVTDCTSQAQSHRCSCPPCVACSTHQSSATAQCHPQPQTCCALVGSRSCSRQ